MKTHAEHVRRVRRVHGRRLAVTGRYAHSLVKVEYSCRQHGVFLALAHNVEAGHGCRVCADERRKVQPEEHVRRVYALHGNSLTVVDSYIGALTGIRYACPKHGVFISTPNTIMSGHGCRRCADDATSRRTRKPHAVYVKEIRAFGLIALDTYTTAHTKIRHQCAQGHVWLAVPGQVRSGHGCPLCDNSQYRRRYVRIGRREVLVQGSEGTAVRLLLESGVKPEDLAFTAAEGRPTFRYKFKARLRVYVPDMYKRSAREVIEVKGPVTLGLWDKSLFAQVRAKGRAVIAAGYAYRLMVIHRWRNIDLGSDWHMVSWDTITRRFSQAAKAQDLRRVMKG